MVSKTKWEKEELLKLLIETRRVLRCDLQEKLHIERKELTADIDIEIKELENKKNNLLVQHGLMNIEGSRYGCDVSLHPELKVFDENTIMERKRILES